MPPLILVVSYSTISVLSVSMDTSNLNNNAFSHNITTYYKICISVFYKIYQIVNGRSSRERLVLSPQKTHTHYPLGHVG